MKKADLHIRLTKELRKVVDDAAKEDTRSPSGVVTVALAEYFERRKRK